MRVNLVKVFPLALFVALSTMFTCVRAEARQRIVGYYAAYKYTIPPDSVEYSNLTDIIVSAVHLNALGALEHKDPQIPFPSLVRAAHKAGVKVLISIGGGNPKLKGYFALVTGNPATRAAMVRNVVDFLETNHYDGVDIDWETPGNADQCHDLTSLVRDLRTTFNHIHPSWLITMAIPHWHIGASFNYPILDKYVDWYNVMCYDYMASWCCYAGHDSPLYASPDDPNGAGSDSATIAFLLSRGIPSEKLVMGVPFYGDLFKAKGLYKPGRFIGQNFYSESMNFISEGWHYNWDGVSEVPYLINPDSTELISYENPRSLELKAEYSVKHHLGGIMIWELSKDMYHGRQPLLEEIANTMRRLGQF